MTSRIDQEQEQLALFSSYT
eukprot:UN14778